MASICISGCKMFIGLQNTLNVFSVLMVFSHMTCAATCGAKTAFGNGDMQRTLCRHANEQSLMSSVSSLEGKISKEIFGII